MSYLSTLWNHVTDICMNQAFSNAEERRQLIKIILVLRPCVVFDSCLDDSEVDQSLHQLLQDPGVNVERFCDVVVAVMNEFPIPNVSKKQGQSQLHRFAIEDDDLHMMYHYINRNRLDLATQFLQTILIPRIDGSPLVQQKHRVSHASLYPMSHPSHSHASLYPISHPISSHSHASLYPISHPISSHSHASLYPISHPISSHANLPPQNRSFSLYASLLALMFALIVLIAFPSVETIKTRENIEHITQTNSIIQTIQEPDLSTTREVEKEEEKEINQPPYTYDQWLSSVIHPNYYAVATKCQQYRAQYLYYLHAKLGLEKLPPVPTKTNELDRYIKKHQAKMMVKLQKNVTINLKSVYADIVVNWNQVSKWTCDEEKESFAAKKYSTYG